MLNFTPFFYCKKKEEENIPLNTGVCSVYKTSNLHWHKYEILIVIISKHLSQNFEIENLK